MKILLKNVRLSFPDLARPAQPMAGSTSGPKYGAQLIFAPDSEAAAVAQAEFARVAREKFGENFAAILSELAKDKKCIRRGDGNLDKAGKVRDGYAGMLYIKASNKQQPAIIAANFHNGKPVFVTESGATFVDGVPTQVPFQTKFPYGGCFVNATVDIYALDKPGQGKSVNATLIGVQFAGDGTSFGGSQVSADGFDSLGDPGDFAPATPAGVDLF